MRGPSSSPAAPASSARTSSTRCVEPATTSASLDALLPAAHRERPDYLDPRAEWIEGDVRDPDTVAARGRRRRRGLPPGGDGRPRRRPRRHRRLRRPQRPRHRGAAARARGRAGSPGRLVLASSMVVYGEGRYALRRARRRAPAAARAATTSTPAASSRRARSAAAPLEPQRGARGRAARSPQRLRRHEGRAGAPVRRRSRRETGATVTALRYHNVYGPRMPRDTPYAGVASIFRSALAAGDAPARVRGRRPAARLRARPRRRPRQPARARGADGAGRVQRRQRHAAHGARHGAGAAARGRAATASPW